MESSSRAESVTKHCQIFSDQSGESVDTIDQSENSFTVAGDQDKPVWIDTVGYDDTDNVDDEETFKNILKFIQQNNLMKIRAVVWTVLPQERKDARLQRQADFINRFREELIWSNVILIVKSPGPGVSSVQRAGQGADEAAKIWCKHGLDNSRKLGFTYYDDSVPADFKAVLDSLDDDKRYSMLYLTTEEVRDRVSEAVESVEEAVQVIFEDARCEDCGVVGDKRLLPDFCHMEKMYHHPLPLHHYHPQQLSSYHPLPEENNHPGVLKLTGNLKTGKGIFKMNLTNNS